MIIRKAKQEDANEIAEIMVSSWQKNFKKFVPEEVLQDMDSKKVSKAIGSSINDDNVLVAESDKNVIGFVGVGENRLTECPNWEAEIQAIHVDYDVKGSGVGTQLLEKAFIELEKLNYRVVGLSVFEDNPANKFYKKHGGNLVGKHQKNMGGVILIENLYEFQLK